MIVHNFYNSGRLAYALQCSGMNKPLVSISIMLSTKRLNKHGEAPIMIRLRDNLTMKESIKTAGILTIPRFWDSTFKRIIGKSPAAIFSNLKLNDIELFLAEIQAKQLHFDDMVRAVQDYLHPAFIVPERLTKPLELSEVAEAYMKESKHRINLPGRFGIKSDTYRHIQLKKKSSMNIYP